jgi:putative ABC transport system substrate-binding protein
VRRRDFITCLGGTALTVPFAARAQQAPGLARIGYLGISSGPLADQFLGGMRENGYIEGRNLSVERREYAGNIPRLAEFAAELVRLKVDAIFATGPGPVRAVANATHDIPLVAIDLESDPVEAGWAASLARPGGNITGVFLDLPELIGK